MKIFLVRHGESTSDVEDRYGGHYDDHLTGKGKRQAQKTVQKLANSGIEVIFSSPFHRARETSEILSKELKCHVKIVDDIKERNRYAHLTGMKKSEAAKKHPEHFAKLKDHTYSVDGGEPYDIFRERILKTFEKLASEPYDVIAIVGHGGPIGCILREVLNLDELKIGKCAYFEIEKKNNELRLLKMENAEFKK